jgi:hypothetical protein
VPAATRRAERSEETPANLHPSAAAPQLALTIRALSPPCYNPAEGYRSTNMPTKIQRIIGWTLTILVGLFLIGASGVPKFLDVSKIPDMANMLAKLQIRRIC